MQLLHKVYGGHQEIKDCAAVLEIREEWAGQDQYLLK
jgi:hypothetical protein